MKIHRILSYILLVTGLSASAATKVSPEVAARFARGDAQVRVLVALEPAESLAPGAEPHAAAEVRARALTASLPPGSFSLRRTYENASVVAGSLTAVGLAALEKRSDVRGVSLDGVVHTVGQAATAHIGADRLASIGVTGFGRSIAIVDTGIDARHPDLGGSGAMNPRLLGGFSFAEMSNDLSDCDGHGTEVAGVVGGPNGIAPDVSFVALKVFKAADGCRSANFSDVLAAVDWAVAKRAEMKIDTVNLSLADEAIRIGFCDSEDPASASLFRAARDAGIAVVAASGNDGKTDGLAWPACFSDVAAVGMVYSVSSGATNWGGSAACRDAISAPDVVPCASNSGTALSLLAPGVNWVTTSVGGGQTSSFSGTSAAAPAAAGAILLTRQARSLGDPVLAFDLLRATGTPVADDKNGITTPRVDVSAAFDATAPITGPCSSMTIPDGSSGGVACEAEVSAIVGRVSTISVALSIEHPDSRQLVATLIGPDGTSALILRGSGRAAHAFREVLGRTVPSAEPLSIFAGHEAAGTWRLVIADETPGASGRIVSWALLVEPVLPAVGTAPFTKNAVIPTTAHRTGRFGSFFTSDVRLFNSDPANAQTVTLRYMAAAREANDPGRQVSVSIPPFGTRVLTDVLGNAFRTDDYGAVFVDAPAGVVSGSRTQSTAVRGGTYGLFVPSLPTAASLGAGPSIQLLVPPFLSTGFRVNVGFTETAGSPATVELSVKDKRGAPKGSVTRTVPPFGLTQINDIYQEIAAQQDENDRFEFRVTGGSGKVVAYATSVDNLTNDGLLVPGASPVPDLIVPAAAHASGLYGATFRTDLKLANPSLAPIRIKFSYFPTTGPSFAPVVLPLGGNETKLIRDVLASLFSPTSDISGALRLTVLDGQAVVASSRTYTDTGGASYGLAISPADAPLDATPGRKIALTFLSGSAQTRTNLGFLETSGRATRTRISLYAANGTRLATKELMFAAFEAVQWNDVFAQLGIAPRDEASAILEVLEGGSVIAHAIQIDNLTNDASFIPGQLLP